MLQGKRGGLGWHKDLRTAGEGDEVHPHPETWLSRGGWCRTPCEGMTWEIGN